jgi:two-component system chemotaxis response regulator CheY
MKTLIVDDDFSSRLLLQELLKNYGPSHIAVNGKEALEAVRLALDACEPYELICLDIMMPEMDGQHALLAIRSLEQARRIVGRSKVIMTTTLTDEANVRQAIEGECDYFLAKPIRKEKLLEQLGKLGLSA